MAASYAAHSEEREREKKKGISNPEASLHENFAKSARMGKHILPSNLLKQHLEL